MSQADNVENRRGRDHRVQLGQRGQSLGRGAGREVHQAQPLGWHAGGGRGPR